MSEPSWKCGPDAKIATCATCGEQISHWAYVNNRYTECDAPHCESIVCESCRIKNIGGEFCSQRCADRGLEIYLDQNEPACCCRQTDVDLFDAEECPLHNDKTQKSATDMQQLCQAIGEPL